MVSAVELNGKASAKPSDYGVGVAVVSKQSRGRQRALFDQIIVSGVIINRVAHEPCGFWRLRPVEAQEAKIIAKGDRHARGH